MKYVNKKVIVDKIIVTFNDGRKIIIREWIVI